MRPRVAIIDLGMGNLFSVKKACEMAGLDAVMAANSISLFNSDAVILPGVGAFADAMLSLRRMDLISPLKDYIASGRFYMGICLGLQLLFTESEEFGLHKGLDVIPGEVKKLPSGICSQKRVKVPQVGWNRIHYPLGCQSLWKESVLDHIQNGTYMYFGHSYYVRPFCGDATLCVTEYEGFGFSSGVKMDNITAFQFHPEKSGKQGLLLYKNWAEIISNVNQENGLWRKY